MKKILVSGLVIVVVVGGIVVGIAWTRSEHMERVRDDARDAAAQGRETAKKEEDKRTRELNAAEREPRVIRSILRGLKVSLEIQPQWKQDKEFLIQVNLEKPLGKTYLVDRMEQSCILYVNKRPRALLRQRGRHGDVRTLLKEGYGSYHPLFRIAPDIPDNSELMVEWVNYNPRTNVIERLRTQPLVWSR